MKKQIQLLSFKYFFIGNLLFWVFLSFAYLIQNYSYAVNMGEKFKWVQSLTYLIPEHFFSFLLCNVIYFLFRYTQKYTWQSFLKIHISSAILYGFLHIILSMSTMVFIRIQIGVLKEPYFQALRRILNSTYIFAINGFMIYCFWIIVLLAIDFYLKYRRQQVMAVELESRLTRSQLQALKMQLQPHFLFNALNTIAMMVRRQKNSEAVEMISGLSDLLRNTLANNYEQFTTLEDELKLLKNYLYIEQIRFKDKFKVEYDIRPETLALQVPNLLLQPIVENAFKYGISKSLHNALLKIETKLNHNYLIINILNTGSCLNPHWKLEENQGVGLSNTLARLKQLYAQDFEFKIENTTTESDEGVNVEIKIPTK